jgi:hypothetical protein
MHNQPQLSVAAARVLLAEVVENLRHAKSGSTAAALLLGQKERLVRIMGADYFSAGSTKFNFTSGATKLVEPFKFNHATSRPLKESKS